MASIDWTTIEKHLRRQGWTLERTTQGHVRAAPPDKSRPLVHFSNSAESRAIHNTLAQLKASGFAWPPAEPISANLGKDNDWIEIHNARVATEELEAVMKCTCATPPEQQQNGRWVHEVTCRQSGNYAPPPPETEEQRVNRMFEELKEAKLHATICKEQEEAAAAKLAVVKLAHETAIRELREAQQALRDKKTAFDQLFVETAVAS